MSVFLDLNKIYKGKLFSDTNQVKQVFYDTTEIPLDVDPVIYSGALTDDVNYSEFLFDVFSSFSVTLKDLYGTYLTVANITAPGFTFVPRPGGGQDIEILVYDDTIQILGAYTDYILGTVKQPPVVLYNGALLEEINTGASFADYTAIKVTVSDQPFAGKEASYTHIFTGEGEYYHNGDVALELFVYMGEIIIANYYSDAIGYGSIIVEGIS